jgi:hypothetical protein
MVRLTVAFRAASARSARDLLESLRYLLASVRFEPGCEECQTWIDPDLAVHYVEGWATEADMRQRVRSFAFTSLLSLMESVREPPHVQFDFVTSTRGLDFVEEVRGDVGSEVRSTENPGDT